MMKKKGAKGLHLKPGHVHVTSARPYSAHHLLNQIAAEAIRRGDADEGSTRHEALIAILTSALAIEALANTLGPRVVDGWDDFNNVRPIAKWRLIYGGIPIKFDSAKEPWISTKWLFALRNSIAHAQPDNVQTEQVMTPAEFSQVERGKMEFPASEVEKQLTMANAKKALKAFEAVRDSLSPYLKPEHGLGIFGDMMTGGARLIPPSPSSTK